METNDRTEVERDLGTLEFDIERSKRTRRNAGDRNAARAEGDEQKAQNETLEILEEKKPKRARRAPSAKRKTDAGKQAQAAVSIIEATAITIAGPDAAMQPIEKFLIEEPLAGVLARIEPKQLEAANSIIAPVLLMAGLALYGARVYGLIAQQRTPEPIQRDLSAYTAPGKVRDLET